MFNNDESIESKYKPLGQILIEKNVVDPEKLDKALGLHWKRCVPLGETLKDLGYITENRLSEALLCQENALA